ncbi:MAG: ABC transporter ATP-binding protein [Myxococcaceae bacterium]|nr:ABC transporter ATP-binding protein [Myxococcaceae bacterium]
MTNAVELKDVSRHYGSVRAVDGVSLSIRDGEFFSLLGPSGSGKTTCLRLIAGFEQPTSGSVLLHGHEAAGLPPYERDVNTVFQDYALFPHMNVRENVAYGLRVKGVDRRTREREAEAALEQVALGGYGPRRPGQLSGGQRQRVALARALVNKPRVLLLDEPLGALDLKLREQMQTELKALQRRLGITFIYVTHDQGEALSMSDRVAVFHAGRIEQVDTPRGLYTRPRTVFVAGFVGTANVMNGALSRRFTGTNRPFSVRPEHIRLARAVEDQAPRAPLPPSTPLPLGEGKGEGVVHPNSPLSLHGRVLDAHYHGAVTRYEVEVEGPQRLTVTLQNGDASATHHPRPGDTVHLTWSREAMVELEPAQPEPQKA